MVYRVNCYHIRLYRRVYSVPAAANLKFVFWVCSKACSRVIGEFDFLFSYLEVCDASGGSNFGGLIGDMTFNICFPNKFSKSKKKKSGIQILRENICPQGIEVEPNIKVKRAVFCYSLIVQLTSMRFSSHWNNKEHSQICQMDIVSTSCQLSRDKHVCEHVATYILGREEANFIFCFGKCFSMSVFLWNFEGRN